MKHWLAEIIVALFAATSLLLFFYPKQPDELVSIEGHENPGSWHVSKGIFPLSDIFIELSYRCLHLHGRTTVFLVDFALPESYRPGDNLRLWIRHEDYEQMQVNPDIEVRVYALDAQNPDTLRWTHYVPRHPHGHGAFLAVGIILTVLLLVMVVNKICFTGSSSTERT